MKTLIHVGTAFLCILSYLPARALSPCAQSEGRSVRDLIRALSDKDRKVRYRAVEELGKLDPPPFEAAPALANTLKDPDYETRFGAAEALARMGQPALP